MKTTYAELTQIEKNRINAYYNACIRRARGIKSAQQDIDTLYPLIRHIDFIKIFNEEFRCESF